MRQSRKTLAARIVVALTAAVTLLASPTAFASDLSVSSLDPTEVTASSATLQGRVTTKLALATVDFQYGTTTAYGAVSAVQTMLALTSDQKFSIPVDGLSPNTTYHLRAVAVSGLSTIYGHDLTFTTAADDGSSGSTHEGSGSSSSGSGSSNAGGDSSEASGDATSNASTATPATTAAPSTATPASTGVTPSGQPVAAPVLGHTVTAGTASGVVKVLSPAGAVVDLSSASSLPTGTIIDATYGVVALTSALDTAGHTQTGRFWGGAFEVRQPAGGHGAVQLVLRGGHFGDCPTGRAATRTGVVARAAATKVPPRSLWGRDHHGRFQVRGRGSVATVRGTRWLTQDRCDGTVTRVTEGAVAVRDLHRHRTVVVTHGHSYLARITR